MLTANNHCYDYGTAGLLRTLEVVNAAGLETLGTVPQATDETYLVKELNGIKVGMICYTFADIEADRNTPIIDEVQTDSKAAGLINVFDYGNLDMFYAEMENNISSMKAAGAESIVLYIHWGDQFNTTPSNSQKSMAQRLCDLGVNVIVGSHPHVVQPIELLTSTDGTRQTLCAYSLGNFLSNQRADNIALNTGHSEDGLMLRFTLVEYNDGHVYVENAELIPTWVLVRGSDNSKTYHILPLNTAAESWKDSYNLSNTQLENAIKSLTRTNAVVDAGLKTVQSLLNQQTIEWGETTGAFTGGVG
jgi:poly-gamma-glutamate synthesis protein (capsule biosynthesis protein)